MGPLQGIILLLSIIISLATCFEPDVGNHEKQILDKLLVGGPYDKRVRPRANGTDDPTHVSVNMYVITLSINEERQTYSMDVYFRLYWQDDRLKFESKRDRYLSSTDYNSIWTPDVFFNNEIKGYLHDITVPNAMIRIYPNGSLLLSKRYQLRMTMQPNYKNYPFDHQELVMNVESYAYKADEMILKWLSDEVLINDKIDLEMFCIHKIETSGNPDRPYQGAVERYSILEFKISIARRINYYLIHVFIPCTTLSIAAYLTFWFDIKFITARVLLSAGTLYTMSAMVQSWNTSTHKVSYTRYVDWFTGISLTFAFAGLVLTAIAQSITNTNTIITDKQDLPFRVNNIRQWLLSTSVNRADALSRIIYPLLFLAFLIIYTIFAYV